MFDTRLSVLRTLKINSEKVLFPRTYEMIKAGKFFRDGLHDAVKNQ